MFAKSLAQAVALACLAVVIATPADAQRRRYDEGYREDYRYGGGCLSSNDINASLMSNGWYPQALVGQRDGGRVLIMRVSQGYRTFFAFVDGCTGQILRMRGAD